jgi:uncharacterized protein (DUF1501 family)
MTALSPVHTVGNQIREAILLHQDVTKEEAHAHAVDMLGRVGIPNAAERINQYPFEMSGGMRQRAVIAMALVCNPELLIADEPTTALDVTIQAQIMGLIKKLQKDMRTSVLLITHDLGVVAQIADDVAVMYLGRIVERSDVRTIIKSPRHPYTMGLLKSLPSLALNKRDCLPLDEGLGWHSAAAGLRAVYDRGELAVIQGVGYPRPNRSHFRSTEIWHTAVDAEVVEQTGWLGRAFDRYYRDRDAGGAVCIGGRVPPSFSAKLPKGITFQQPGALRFRARRGRGGMQEEDVEFWEDMNDGESYHAGGSIEELGGRIDAPEGMSAVEFLERTARDARVNAERIDRILKRTRSGAEYPDHRLGRSLEQMARLIRGGMPASFYAGQLGGFDTHTQQDAAHRRLLTELGDSLRAFSEDLAGDGLWKRTAVLVFSEFGRRAKENGSRGTDHGAAGPVFVLGGGIRGGVYGRHPGLAPEELQRGDPVFHTDFRSVYTTLLDRHMGIDPEPVLGRAFPRIDFI